MNEEVVTDLKQFIVGVVTQQTTDLRQELGQVNGKLDDLSQEVNQVNQKLGDLRQEVNEKLDNLSHAVAEALDVSNEVTEARLQDHDRRLTRIEGWRCQPKKV